MAAQRVVQITAPNFQQFRAKIVGTSPLMLNKFSVKAREMMREAQASGQIKRRNKPKAAKDFKAAYEEAQYVSAEGWHGIPATAFRAAMISACRVVGFPMTRAKLALFIEADGFDTDDGTPLVKITKGKPQYSEMPVRNESGVCDLRPRPLWKAGWEATVTVRYDADMLDEEQAVNLLLRAGQQVGVGEGRPDSRKSTGLGFGMFRISND